MTTEGSIQERRITLFERQDIVKDLNPVLIAAIQRELVEMRMEYESKVAALERVFDTRLLEVIELASKERLTMEKLRLQNPQERQWEVASEGSQVSRSVSKSSR